MLTSTGLVVGSPGFMSPEQADGREVGPPSDIFSLGAVLAFAATGEGPFGNGSTPALVYRVVFSPPNLDRLPAEVRPLIARCLDKDPAQRPTAARLLAEAGAAYPGAGWLPAPVTRAFTQLSAPATRPAHADTEPAHAATEPAHAATRPAAAMAPPPTVTAAMLLPAWEPRAQPGPATAAAPLAAAAGCGGDRGRVPRGLGHGRLRPDELSAPFTRRSIRRQAASMATYAPSPSASGRVSSATAATPSASPTATAAATPSMSAPATMAPAPGMTPAMGSSPTTSSSAAPSMSQPAAAGTTMPGSTATPGSTAAPASTAG